MSTLRHLAVLHRCVLAWFLLSLGVAVAAPVVHPQAMELVCSAAGAIKVIVHRSAWSLSRVGSPRRCRPRSPPPSRA
jgi:hypothetical protein